MKFRIGDKVRANAIYKQRTGDHSDWGIMTIEENTFTSCEYPYETSSDFYSCLLFAEDELELVE